jgi:predicted nucleotidyltransferase
MRLSPQQAQKIVEATTELAGPGASVLLFGSRLDDAIRGGDIDLLVQCPEPVDSPVLLAADIEARLQVALGEQRIDVLVIDPVTSLQPVHRAALRTGRRLLA